MMVYSYELGLALAISSFVILVVVLILYLLDTITHSWLIWVIIFLVILFLAGILLISMEAVNPEEATEIILRN